MGICTHPAPVLDMTLMEILTPGWRERGPQAAGRSGVAWLEGCCSDRWLAWGPRGQRWMPGLRTGTTAVSPEWVTCFVWGGSVTGDLGGS